MSDAETAQRASCHRCKALPWYSISQPTQEAVECGNALVEMLSCKRHLSVILAEDFDHQWDPREVHLLLWDEDNRAEERAAFPVDNADDAMAG